MSIVYLLAAYAACYLICSINFAVIISKIVTKKDIRQQGSGNAGMTNMMRSVGKTAGLLTLVLDAAKGVGAMLLCYYVILPMSGISEVYIRYCFFYFCALFCILGHDFPLFFGFKGGKGIATSLGVFFVVDWRVAVFCLAVFLVIFVICRIVSLASVTATVLVAMTTFLINTLEAGIYFGALSGICMIFPVAVVLYMHRSNISKLIKGEEKQLKIKK
ncbi:MAG: glycerol-3-phosphate 1-O-acyltransferase PlsY [Acutalibacteraceae bacterium]|nr:glycerol-3-phosphate 1-O-acyltransferase PlsY [Acutalibacteraceae bacterium]